MCILYVLFSYFITFLLQNLSLTLVYPILNTLESLILEISYYAYNKRSIFLWCTEFVHFLIKFFFSSYLCNLVFLIVFSQVYNSQSHTGYSGIIFSITCYILFDNMSQMYILTVNKPEMTLVEPNIKLQNSSLQHYFFCLLHIGKKESIWFLETDS